MAKEKFMNIKLHYREKSERCEDEKTVYEISGSKNIIIDFLLPFEPSFLSDTLWTYKKKEENHQGSFTKNTSFYFAKSNW